MNPIFANLLHWLKKKILQSGSIYKAQNLRYRQFQVGKWSYGSPTVLSWGEGATLRIGKYCSIAPEVTILLGGEHRVDWVRLIRLA